MKTLVLVVALAMALSSSLPAQVVSAPASTQPAGSAQPIYRWVSFPAYQEAYQGFYGVFGLPIVFSAGSFGATFVITGPSPKAPSEATEQVAPRPPEKVKSVTCEYYWPSPNQITGSTVASEPRSSCR